MSKKHHHPCPTLLPRGYTAAQQVSTFPEPHWRRNVTYFQDLLGMFNTTNSSVFAKHDWAGRIEPPHRCQQGCNGRGICSANEVEVQGQEFTVTRCQCMQVGGCYHLVSQESVYLASPGSSNLGSQAIVRAAASACL